MLAGDNGDEVVNGGSATRDAFPGEILLGRRGPVSDVEGILQLFDATTSVSV